MKALYAGSFDPITNGHIDIIEQASKVFDGKIVIGIANNPEKHYTFTSVERYGLIKESIPMTIPNPTIEIYNGMTVEFTKEIGAEILIRGLRAVSDFDIEFQMTQFNRRLPPGCNTIFFMPDETNFYLSSTAIRGIAKMGGDISQFVPACVVKLYEEKFGKD